MKIRKPQVQLVFKKRLIDPAAVEYRNEYYLHVVTYFDVSNFVAVEEPIVDDKLDPNGVLNVVVKVKEDPSLPQLGLITPVVHLVRLGTLPFEDVTKGVIKTTLIEVEDGIAQRDGGQNGSQSSTSDAVEDDRPTKF